MNFKNRNLLGIIFMTLGMLCLSINDVIVKGLNAYFPVWEIVFFRALSGLIISLGLIFFFGVNKLKQELTLNKINVTSVNSVGYFTDPYYFKQNEKILQIAKIINPDLVCLITGGFFGGPNPISNEYVSNNEQINFKNLRDDTNQKIILLFEQASKLNLTLGLEPIGSWEILKKGHFNSISSCSKLIKDNNHKLIIDLYHSFTDINLDTFLRKSSKLGLLQFSNINFDENLRPIGRKTINNLNNRNNLELSKYIKFIFNRKDKIKIEFEVFQSDVNEDPKEIILKLKSEILKLL